MVTLRIGGSNIDVERRRADAVILANHQAAGEKGVISESDSDPVLRIDRSKLELLNPSKGYCRRQAMQYHRDLRVANRKTLDKSTGMSKFLMNRSLQTRLGEGFKCPRTPNIIAVHCYRHGSREDGFGLPSSIPTSRYQNCEIIVTEGHESSPSLLGYLSI
jgi:hypothetical protein